MISPLQGDPYGSHWNAFAQAQNNSFAQSYLGALGAQNAFAQQALAQQAQYLAQYPAIAQFPSATSPPLEDAGISAGEIIGHRAWRCSTGGLLQSMAVGTIWPPDEPMTGDVRRDGVHAFKSQSDALTEYALTACRVVPVAIGTVMLWGEVIEHERGYRAEFARVDRINLICGVGFWRERRLLRRLSNRYHEKMG